MKNLKLDKKLPLGLHKIEITKMENGEVLAHELHYCDGFEISRENLSKFYQFDNLYIDDKFIGKLINVFQE